MQIRLQFIAHFSDPKIRKLMANQSKRWNSRCNSSSFVPMQNNNNAVETLSPQHRHRQSATLNALNQFDQYALVDASAMEAFGTLLTKKHITIFNRSMHDAASTTATRMPFGTAKSKKQRQFCCTYCSFSCTWLYDLKIHLKQKHKILK